jgi:hypothetical protein
LHRCCGVLAASVCGRGSAKAFGASDAVTPQLKQQYPEVIGSFEYSRSHQERMIRELIGRMELHDELQRSIELKTLNQSSITTILELERFLSPKAYKRADGSPILDLTF